LKINHRFVPVCAGICVSNFVANAEWLGGNYVKQRTSPRASKEVLCHVLFKIGGSQCIF
jgi:hypothetical protein